MEKKGTRRTAFPAGAGKGRGSGEGRCVTRVGVVGEHRVGFEVWCHAHGLVSGLGTWWSL